MDDRFLEGYSLLKIPVIENGEPAWPEKWPIEAIEKLRRAVGEARFSAQMMLEPTDLNTGHFKAEDLKYYADELRCEENNRILNFSLGGAKITGYSAWWDPSGAGYGGDFSVAAIVFKGAGGERYIHDVEYISAREGEKIGGRSQCARIIDFLRRNMADTIYIETNGLGALLPEMLGAEAARQGFAINLRPRHSRTPKALRIQGAFAAGLAAGMIMASERVRNSQFMAEFIEWRPDSRGHDDGMDAAAGALSSEPTQLPKTTLWRRTGARGRIFRIRKEA